MNTTLRTLAISTITTLVIAFVLIVGLPQPVIAMQGEDTETAAAETAAAETSVAETSVAETSAAGQVDPDSSDTTDTAASQPRSAVDEEGRVVQFQRDIAPILALRCQRCHGAEDAKNDFRVDLAEEIMYYIEPGDVEGSSMYIDYVATDDEDMLMPPRSEGGPLSPGELALLRTWIAEGADWPEGVSLPSEAEAKVQPPATADVAPKKLLQRVWAFQGYLHPATVHFPIALLLVAALFVVLGFKWPVLGTQVPLALLILGAVSAVVASMMGWAFATEQGYGSWSRFDLDSEIFWHRWSGVAVAGFSVLLLMIAAVALWRDSEKLTRLWKIGLLVAAAMVGAVGHQGGELNYGKDFYPKAFRILLGQNEAENAPVQPHTDDDAEPIDAAE